MRFACTRVQAVVTAIPGHWLGCDTGFMALHLTGDDDADRLLTDNPLALLLGMLLDQRVR